MHIVSDIYISFNIDFDLGKIKAETMGEFMGDNESESSLAPATAKVPPPPQPTIVKGFEPTPMQRPFQSSSTPVHLSNRFMVCIHKGDIVYLILTMNCR